MKLKLDDRIIDLSRVVVIDTPTESSWSIRLYMDSGKSFILRFDDFGAAIGAFEKIEEAYCSTGFIKIDL